ncbi:pyridoxamine 5'-phosphate oxidase [bacterium]|nr:pyridoxamine 5'-phosphate oxidase [bacterium]
MDVMAVLAEWMETGARDSGSKYPEAACLSTVGIDGYPDGRIVLIRGVSDRGLTFFTNSLSAKGRELAECPKGALTIYWESLGRQIRAVGDVESVSDAESDLYFSNRPRTSRLGAWASRQSEPLVSRDALEAAVAELDQRYEGQEVPRPPHWFGYRLKPIRVEFWQEGDFRLHDRFLYRLQNGRWIGERLNP